jgi:hypothetical protein
MALRREEVAKANSHLKIWAWEATPLMRGAPSARRAASRDP